MTSEAWRGTTWAVQQSPGAWKKLAQSPWCLCFSSSIRLCAYRKSVHRAFPKVGSTGVSGRFSHLLTLVLQVLMNCFDFRISDKARTRSPSAKGPEVVWSLKCRDGGCPVTTPEISTLLCAGSDHWVTATTCPACVKPCPSEPMKGEPGNLSGCWNEGPQLHNLPCVRWWERAGLQTGLSW